MSDDNFGDDLPPSAPRVPKKKKRPPEAGGRPAAPQPKAQPASGGTKPSQIVAGIVLGLFMVGLIGVAVFMAMRQQRGQAGTEQAFVAEIDQLLQPPKEGTPPAAKPGKLAELDVDKRTLYVFHNSLPNELRAASPAEADYIVQVRETRDVVTQYTGGGNGIKVTAELTVIDKPTWTVLGRKSFSGDDPPPVTVGSGTDVVEMPDRDEVTAFYRGLLGIQ